MPTVPAPRVKPKTGSLKIFGQPAWVVVAAAGLAVVAGLYLRHRVGGSAATGPSTASSPGAADTSGGAGSSAATPADLTPYSDLASALNGLTYVLGSGGDFQLGSSVGGDTSAPASSPAAVTTSTGDVTEPLTAADPKSPAPASSPAAQAPTHDAAPAVHQPLLGGSYTDPALASATGAGSGVPVAKAVQEVGAGLGKVPPQQIPAPPHNAATNVMPAPAAKKPPSGYSEKSTAKQLH